MGISRTSNLTNLPTNFFISLKASADANSCRQSIIALETKKACTFSQE